jgi:TRAP-type transport system periplasmic protein
MMHITPRSRRAFLGTLAASGMPFVIPLPGRAASPEAYTMRLGVTNTITSVQGATALRFATAVRHRSNGQLNVEVYPNGQLAQQQESVDALTTGSIDLTIAATAFLAPLFPQYQLFDLPFLFKDPAAGFRVLDGPIGTEFFAQLEPKGIVGLGWGYVGVREIETTSKPVIVPEDMKGIRIRVQPGAVYVATFQALGAIPLAIDANETFTALSQHTLDAVELPIPSFTALKFQTVCRHVAMSNHVFSVLTLLGSKRKIEALPVALQRIIKDEARAVVPFWRAAVARETVGETQVLRQSGLAFTETRYPAFYKAVEPVYALVQSKLGGSMLDRLTRAANTT